MVSILLGLQFPLFVCLAKIGERRPLRNLGAAEELFYRGFRNLFAVSDTILLHIRLNIRRARQLPPLRFSEKRPPIRGVLLTQLVPPRNRCRKELPPG